MRRLLNCGLCKAMLGAAVVTVTLLTVPTAAPAADNFYKGKTITIVISAGPGGGYATYVLTMARHMMKHIPGHPEYIRQHRQGAGGIVAANYLYNAAKRDGTVIAIIHRGAVSTSAVFHEKGVKYDPRKFSWIGSITKETNLCVSYYKSPVKTFKDLMKTPLIVGGIGPGSDTDLFAILYNNLFGTRLKLITGYHQGTAITLAMERGEVQGRCGWSYSSIKATKGEWLREHKLHFLVINGLSRDPALPGVPLGMDFATTQRQKDIIELAVAPQEMARPILGPPGIPKDRLKILRTAFNETMKDPAFLAEAKKRKLDVAPLTGQQVEALVTNLMSKPADIVNATIDAISRKDRTEVHFAKLKIIEVTSTIAAVKRGGRVIAFKVKGGKTHQASISGHHTKVSIGGKKAKRSALKAGMTCAIKYTGNSSMAESVDCK